MKTNKEESEFSIVIVYCLLFRLCSFSLVMINLLGKVVSFEAVVVVGVVVLVEFDDIIEVVGN